MDLRNNKSFCKGQAKSGKPCRAAATPGGLCYFHANPDKAAELGRMGGRSRRRPLGMNADPLPKLDTALAVRDTVARLIADVYTGSLHPRVAVGLARLVNLQLRAIETADLEQRIAELEKLFDEAEAQGGGSLDDSSYDALPVQADFEDPQNGSGGSDL